MRKKGHLVLSLILIFLIAVGFRIGHDYLVYDYFLKTNIDYCHSFFTSSGKIKDIQNELGVHSIDDVSVTVRKDGKVSIAFGKIDLKFKDVDSLVSDKSKELLKKLYIEPSYKNDTLKVKYKDKEVSIWFET